MKTRTYDIVSYLSMVHGWGDGRVTDAALQVSKWIKWSIFPGSLHDEEENKGD